MNLSGIVDVSRPFLRIMFYLCMYLTVLGLSYGMWDLQYLLQHEGSFSFSLWDLCSM